MAISRCRAAANFKQSMRYCFREGASIIGGNLVKTHEFDGLTTDEAKQVIEDASDAFALSQFTNPGLEQHYSHVSISLAPGEDLKDLDFTEVAFQHAAGMIAISQQPELADQLHALATKIDRVRLEELQRYQMVVFRHTDKPHNHVHYLQSRVDLVSAAAIRTSHERYHAQAVMRVLEDRFQLQRGQNSWDKKQPERERAEAKEYQQNLGRWLQDEVALLQQLERGADVELGAFRIQRRSKNEALGLEARTNIYRAEDLDKGQAKHGFAPRPALILYDDGAVGGTHLLSRDEAQEFKFLLLERLEQFNNRDSRQSQYQRTPTHNQRQLSRGIER